MARCNLVDHYSIDFPNYHRLMVHFRIAIDCPIRFQTYSPSRLSRSGFRFHWNHSQKRNHWSNLAASSLATNSLVPIDYRCLDLANPIGSPICYRFPSWSIHSPNYRNDCFRYRSNRSDWSHSYWMIPSSWRYRNRYSWHRLSKNRFRATNPIHSIQTDWNPIRSNPIGLSQTHWSLIRWNHWICLIHSTPSLIRSTSDCSSTKARSVMSIRLNHLMNRWTRRNPNLMNGSNRLSLMRRSLMRRSLMPRNSKTRGWMNLDLMTTKQSWNLTDRSTMNLPISCC
jgi:hypothetical protein